MERNLLLGNGINAHLCIKELNVIDIANRFADSIIKYNDFWDILFGVRFTPKICQELYSRTEKRGIESLATTAYEYLTNKIENISVNDQMRILDSIICCAITAIFYKENIKIGNDYKIENLPDLSKYAHVYTLNYAEFWDTDERCIYLHGKYDIASVKENSKEVLLYSLERNIGFCGYNELVKKLEDDYNMYELNTRNIIFSPEFYKKSEMASMGSHPSNHLYPADDLFLHKFKPLYGELNGIQNIEIFGMSPYGDDDLLKILNSMKNIIVYVYNYKDNEESKVWNRILTCSHEIKDSTDIMK